MNKISLFLYVTLVAYAWNIGCPV